MALLFFFLPSVDLSSQVAQSIPSALPFSFFLSFSCSAFSTRTVPFPAHTARLHFPIRLVTAAPVPSPVSPPQISPSPSKETLEKLYKDREARSPFEHGNNDPSSTSSTKGTKKRNGTNKNDEDNEDLDDGDGGFRNRGRGDGDGSGGGRDNNDPKRFCPTCHGNGWTPCPECAGEGVTDEQIKDRTKYKGDPFCMECEGTGMELCSDCGGSGLCAQSE